MLNTPLTRLRKAAPGSITLAHLQAFFTRKRYPRAIATISAFERGVYKSPPDRFIKVYAEAIGHGVGDVVRALQATQRMRARAIGPFVRP